MLEPSGLVGDPRILENEGQSRLMKGCAAIASGLSCSEADP